MRQRFKPDRLLSIRDNSAVFAECHNDKTCPECDVFLHLVLGGVAAEQPLRIVFRRLHDVRLADNLLDIGRAILALPPDLGMVVRVKAYRNAAPLRRLNHPVNGLPRRLH
ncbi:hypothetical protein D3C81_1740460 [compost metagenome]